MEQQLDIKTRTKNGKGLRTQARVKNKKMHLKQSRFHIIQGKIRKIKGFTRKTESTLYSFGSFTENRVRDYADSSENEVNSATNTITHTSKDISKRGYEISKNTAKKAFDNGVNHARQAKRAQKAMRNARKTSNSARTAKRAAIETRHAAHATEESARATAKTAAEIAKKIAQALEKLFEEMMKYLAECAEEFAAILGEAAVPVLIAILVIVLVVAIGGTAYGILLASGDTTSEMTLATVKLDIENNFYSQIEDIKKDNEHDKVVIKGQTGAWQSALAIYAVYINMDPDNPDEVITMNEEKAEKLEYIYNLLNEIDYDIDYVDADDEEKIDKKTTGEDTYVEESDEEETDDEKIAILIIEIEQNDIDDVIEELDFTSEQEDMVYELLSDKFNSEWTSLLGAPVYIQSSNENVQYIYTYLTTKMGFNGAAACGIIANIQYESGFNPTALGDQGTSYGICQWHKGRYRALVKFCENNGYIVSTLDGQLEYLNSELINNYPKVYDYLMNVSDDSMGAYQAAVYWCKYFEVPANADEQSILRGECARGYYATLSN